MVNRPTITTNFIEGTAEAKIGDRSILFIGSKSSAGLATVEEIIEVSDLKDARTKFGENSYLTAILEKAFESNNKTKISALPLDNGTEAVEGKITLDGASTENATLCISVADINKKFLVEVVIGDTAEIIATKIKEAFDNTGIKYITATASATEVQFTSEIKNKTGSLFRITYTRDDLSGVSNIAGVTHSVVQFSGGSALTLPTNLEDILGTDRYTGIMVQSTIDITPLQTIMQDKLTINNKVLDGFIMIGKVDTDANLISFAQGLNSIQPTVICGMNTTHDDFIDFNVATSISLIELRLTDKADISTVLKTRDVTPFGGASIAGVPIAGTDISNTPTKNIRQETIVDNLNNAGVTVFENNGIDTKLIIGKVVTTRQTDDTGASLEGNSWVTLNTYLQSSVARELMHVSIKSKAQQKQIDKVDATNSNPNIWTKSRFKEILLAEYKKIARLSIYSSSASEFKRFSEELEETIVFNLAEGSIQYVMSPTLTGQLRDIFGTIKINTK